MKLRQYFIGIDFQRRPKKVVLFGSSSNFGNLSERVSSLLGSGEVGKREIQIGLKSRDIQIFQNHMNQLHSGLEGVISGRMHELISLIEQLEKVNSENQHEIRIILPRLEQLIGEILWYVLEIGYGDGSPLESLGKRFRHFCDWFFGMKEFLGYTINDQVFLQLGLIDADNRSSSIQKTVVPSILVLDQGIRAIQEALKQNNSSKLNILLKGDRVIFYHLQIILGEVHNYLEALKKFLDYYDSIRLIPSDS